MNENKMTNLEKLIEEMGIEISDPNEILEEHPEELIIYDETDE